MPHLDTVAYMSQYIWALITLSFLYSWFLLETLPRLQQQLASRAHADDKAVEVSWDVVDVSCLFWSV